MSQFWDGFEKHAVSKTPKSEPTERLRKMNGQGGMEPRLPEEEAAAQQADLKTLPKGTEGTNCFNCRFIRIIDKKAGTGFCTNPNVSQDVSDRMVCVLWDAPGVFRGFEQRAMDQNKAMVAEANQMNQMPDPTPFGAELGPKGANPALDSTQPVLAEAPQSSGGIPVEPGPGAQIPEEAAQTKPEKKPAHTVNINVGSKK